MAADAAHIHAKVAKLLSRRYGKPVLKPKAALVLGDRVSNKKVKLSEAACVSEISVLMACWKENAFNEKACSSELKIFYDCVAKAEAHRKAGLQEELPAGWHPPDKVNKLLRNFPNRRHEI